MSALSMTMRINVRVSRADSLCIFIDARFPKMLQSVLDQCKFSELPRLVGSTNIFAASRGRQNLSDMKAPAGRMQTSKTWSYARNACTSDSEYRRSCIKSDSRRCTEDCKLSLAEKPGYPLIPLRITLIASYPGRSYADPAPWSRCGAWGKNKEKREIGRRTGVEAGYL